MNLREFNSNSSDFLKSIPKEDVAIARKVYKLLGMIWDRENDTLSPAHNEKTFPCTKRGLLKHLASYYDPTGVMWQ